MTPNDVVVTPLRTRNKETQVEAGTTAKLRIRYVVRFAIDGDLRFASHQDTMRMIVRAMDRAQLPVRFSEGFNPRERVSLPLPRSVGMTADDELLVVELTEAVAPEELLSRLESQSPRGLRWHGAGSIVPANTPHPRRAHYEVRLDLPAAELVLREGGPQEATSVAEAQAAGANTPNDIPAGISSEQLQQAIARLMAADTWPITRRTGAPGREKTRDLDLRPLIESLSLAGSCLRMVLPITDQGSARPAEVLEALGLAGRHLAHCIRRTRVEWEPPLPD